MRSAQIHRAATKPETAHQLARRQLQSFAKMLRDACCANAYRQGGYLNNVGEIIDVVLTPRGGTLAITIDSFDEPPVRSILRLKVTTEGETK